MFSFELLHEGKVSNPIKSISENGYVTYEFNSQLFHYVVVFSTPYSDEPSWWRMDFHTKERGNGSTNEGIRTEVFKNIAICMEMFVNEYHPEKLKISLLVTRFKTYYKRAFNKTMISKGYKEKDGDFFGSDNTGSFHYYL